MSKAAHWAKVTSELAAKYGIDFKAAKRGYDVLKAREGRTPSLRMVAGLPARIPNPVHRAVDPKWGEKQAAAAAARRKAQFEAAKAPPPKAKGRGKGKGPEPVRGPLAPRREPVFIDDTGPGSGRGRGGKKRPASKVFPLPRNVGDRPNVERGSILPAPVMAKGEPARVNPRQKGRNRFERMLVERGLPVGIARDSGARAMVSKWRDPVAQEKLANLLAKAYRQVERGGGVTVGLKDKIRRFLDRTFGSDNVTMGVMGYFLKGCYSKGGKK